MAHPAGTERLPGENKYHEQNKYTMTCTGIKLEVSSEDEVVLGEFDDVCGLCGRHFAVLDQLKDCFNKHTDEVCCHLCPTKFSNINSLTFHIKNVHTSLCKSCILRKHLTMQWAVKTEETPEEKPQLIKVEEVILENKEVEIKYIKEEEKEEMVGMFEEEVEEDLEKMVERFEAEIIERAEEEEEGMDGRVEEEKKMVGRVEEEEEEMLVTNEQSSLKEPFKSDITVKRYWQDHNYFSTKAHNSIRDTTNDVVMYTSNDSVVVVINKTDTSRSPKDANTEIDQQETPVGDQTGICNNHAYISPQSHASIIPPVEQDPAHNICSKLSKITDNVIDPSTENQHVFDTRVSPKVPEHSERYQEQTESHEFVHLLDHDYVSTQSLENHPFLSKMQSKDDTLKNHNSDVPLAEEYPWNRNTVLLQSSECNIKMEKDFQPISEDAVIEEQVEIIQSNDHAHNHILSIDDLVYTFDDLCSKTISPCTNRYILNEDNNRKSCGNADQKPIGPVGSVNPKPTASSCKLQEMCAHCDRSKVFNGKVSNERCTCQELSKNCQCSVCGMLFGTETILLTHLANKHPSVKYICTGCKHFFPNQNIFLQHVCSKSLRYSRETFKEPDRFERHQNQTRHELMHSNLLDHDYVSTQSHENHPVLSKQMQSKEDTWKNHSNVSLIAENTWQSSTALQPSQGDNIMVRDNSQPILKEAVLEEHVGVIQRSDHKDRHSLSIDELINTSQDDMCSNGYILNEDCKRKSWSAGQIQTCGNADQKPPGPVGFVNSNAQASFYKVPQMCTLCGRNKVFNAKDSMEQCTCQESLTCSLCGMVFNTEHFLLTHQADKHPSAKYICARCKQLFPNQSIFLKHVCSNSTSNTAFSRESFTLTNGSNYSKEPPLPILKLMPLPAAEYLKHPISCQSVRAINTVQKLDTVLNSTLHSLPKSPSTIVHQKASVHTMTTRSTSCSQKKGMSNGNQKDKMTASVSTVIEKPERLVQVVNTLQAVTQTTTTSFSPYSFSFSFSSSSTQNQGQLIPIPAVSMSNQTGIVKMQDFSQLSQPQQQLTSRVQLLQTIPSQVCNSISIPSQTDQQTECNVPFCSFSSPTPIFPVSQGPLKIVAMFVNQSRELALQKRMRQSWRSKAVFPCRRCGAVSRQFSLGVRHRYQHRGPRLYRCQCGRTFHQRMHLLRHQVQHAEATRYVCAACGQMFCGTRLLACHRLFTVTHSNRKKHVIKECRNIFQCYCGHSFTRPAALLWHMLKNS